MKLNDFITDIILNGLSGTAACNKSFKAIGSDTRLNIDTISFDIYVDDNLNLGGKHKLTLSISMDDSLHGNK